MAYFSGAKCRGVNMKEQLSITQVFNVSGVDKEEFLRYAEKKKATYADWGEDWC